MIGGLVNSWLFLVLPCYVAWRLKASVWTLWWILVANIALGAALFYVRFRSGRWRQMRVIEA